MRVVKYVGTAHTRRITAADWRSADLDGETVEWSFRNGFTVPADQFSDDQIEYVIEPDNGFVIIGGEEDEVKPRRLPRRMTPRQADGVKIDMMSAVKPEGEVTPQEANAGNTGEAAGGGTAPTTLPRTTTRRTRPTTTGTGSGSD